MRMPVRAYLYEACLHSVAYSSPRITSPSTGSTDHARSHSSQSAASLLPETTPSA